MPQVTHDSARLLILSIFEIVAKNRDWIRVYSMTLIKLVLFDALHTIITPRLPIHVQYAHVFQPYLGVLDPTRVQIAFKTGVYRGSQINESHPYIAKP